MKNQIVQFIKNNWSYKSGILNSDKMFKAAVLIPILSNK